MRINGTLIGTLKASSKNDCLLDRTIEIYEDKLKFKIYLFNSGYLDWHNRKRILQFYTIPRKNKDAISIKEINNIIKEINSLENINMSWNGKIYETNIKYTI